MSPTRRTRSSIDTTSPYIRPTCSTLDNDNTVHQSKVQTSASSSCPGNITVLSTSSTDYRSSSSDLEDLEDLDSWDSDAGMSSLPPKRPAKEQFEPSEFVSPFQLLGCELVPTKAFDRFIEWVHDRHAIWEARNKGLPHEKWTDNQFLPGWKWCNVYRFLDAQCQFLIRVVIGKAPKNNPEEMLFRVLFHSLFNRQSTWNRLQSRLHDGFCWRRFNAERWLIILNDLNDEERLHTDAYITPAPPPGYHTRVEYEIHELLPKMMKALPSIIERAQYAADILCHLLEYPTIGDFMAVQIFLNLSYSDLFSFNPNDVILAGVGAERGLNRCFGNSIKNARIAVPEMDRHLIRYVVDNQAHLLNANPAKPWQPLTLPDAQGNTILIPLHLEDVEHAFCEVDKYCRLVYHNRPGELLQTPKTRYTFNPARPTPSAFLPPALLARMRCHLKLGMSCEDGEWELERLSDPLQDRDTGKWTFLVHWRFWDDAGEATREYMEDIPASAIRRYRISLRKLHRPIKF
ncbi:hypothetical protein DL96DRAFT_1813537 [Flagelloscypha sp. PMI_526]|nr:hypothetical protein DL96DRAFT_1813537 [Flagelloscypha sp. PMI_526]